MQILNSQPTPNKWASALGTGLQDLLSGLVEKKTEEMNYQRGLKRAREPLVPVFGQEGADFIGSLPPELQKLAFQNPQLVANFFNKKNNASNNPLMAGMNELNPPSNNPESIDHNERARLFADSFTSPQEKRLREESERKNRKEAREERREERETGEKSEKRTKELVASRASLADLVKTAESALANAKKASFGTVNSALAENPHLRGKLDKYSAALDTDASHLVNLKAELLKGPASMLRLAGISREKPSLGKNKEETERILRDYIKYGKQQLQIFDKDYPHIKQRYEETNPEIEQSQQQAQEQQQGLTKEDLKKYIGDVTQYNGQYFLWDPSIEEYRRAVAKGNQ